MASSSAWPELLPARTGDRMSLVSSFTDHGLPGAALAGHPAHAAEQAYVTRSYELLDKGLASVEHIYQSYRDGNLATASALKRALDVLRNSRGAGQLVFGRVDQDGEPLYIGRRRVHDESKNLVVASWHAPAAQVFYEATPADTRGLELKRVFVEQDRVLAQVIDEITAAAAADLLAPDAGAPASIGDALLLELDRSRDGAMREVVATIQAEQFRVIRAPRNQVLVVQGGPGTGKTVVGLHRAAWHAFNDEELRRAGILVVVPSTAFLSYMSGVLPSLDVSDVLQVDLAALYAGEAMATAHELPDVARVKGSADMAVVLQRALTARRGWGQNDLEFSLGGARTTLPAERVRALVNDVAARELPHNQARDVLRQSLSAAAYTAYVAAQNSAGRAVIATEPQIRRLSAFTNALDRMWPSYTAEDFLRGLFGTQTWLVDASSGVLTADDRARLYREPQSGVAEETWTTSDLYCLDELAHLLNGETRTYGHIVVDEAQDLSPMQARALARRCPDGSFTILGDLAQATGPWIRDSWSELTEHLADGEVQVETLSIGYRVPRLVIELAARLLPLISPGLTAPNSVRTGAGAPTVHLAADEPAEGRALGLAVADVEQGLTTAIVAADHSFDALLAAYRETGVIVGDGRSGDFAHQLTLVPASSVKGLEFDSVIVLHPSELVGATVDGQRLLYVAMTRCTQVLRLVDAEDLPAGLDHLVPRDVPVERLDGAPITSHETAVDVSKPAGEPSLLELIDRLSDVDRALVVSLVNRLLQQEGSDDLED
jgi:DNA helicase IV